MAKKITIVVDGKSYSSKKYALSFFKEAMYWCDGSEQDRMTFAYFSIVAGYTRIDTYNERAI